MNTAEQSNQIIVYDLITWLITILLLLAAVNYIYKPVNEKLKEEQALSNHELQALSRQLLNAPFTNTLFFIAGFLFYSTITIYTSYLVGVSLFFNISQILVTIAGLFTTPPIVFYASGYFLGKENKEVSSALFRRNIELKAIFLSSAHKNNIAFIGSIMGMSIFIVGVLYYYAINKNIEQKRDFNQNYISQMVKFTESLQQISADSSFLEEEIRLRLPDGNKNFCIINHLSQLSKLDVGFIGLPQLQSILERNISGSFFDNQTNTIWTVQPLASGYWLIYQDSISQIKSYYSDYTLWASILILMGFSVVFSILLFYNMWFKDSLNYINQLFTHMSKGDFSISGGKSTNDTLGLLIDHYNLLQKSINGMLSKMKKTSEKAFFAGGELDQVAHTIAQQANEQAATTEEISASMEEMLSTVNSSNEKATEAEKLFKITVSELNESYEVLKKTIEMVQQISQKIVVISEIASKTDLLSINAAIEASRAGESGKGFSIVASEIRKLSDKTRMVSNDIESLSKYGNNISEEAGRKLKILVEEINQSLTNVEFIVEANKEQENGIYLVNNAVAQSTGSANQYSLSAEKLTISASELKEQMQQMIDSIKVFKTEE
jgi:methyl-accepting chemotaxis protein